MLHYYKKNEQETLDMRVFEYLFVYQKGKTILKQPLPLSQIGEKIQGHQTSYVKGPLEPGDLVIVEGEPNLLYECFEEDSPTIFEKMVVPYLSKYERGNVKIRVYPSKLKSSVRVIIHVYNEDELHPENAVDGRPISVKTRLIKMGEFCIKLVFTGMTVKWLETNEERLVTELCSVMPKVIPLFSGKPEVEDEDDDCPVCKGELELSAERGEKQCRNCGKITILGMG